MKSKVLLIGISGVTCSGKSTMVSTLEELFRKSVIFRQDDYFLKEDDPRQVMCEEVDHVNYDILTSLDMAKMYEDLTVVIGDREVVTTVRRREMKGTDLPSDLVETVNKKLDKENVQLIILDGFLLFGYEPFLSLISLKYFLTLDFEECAKRRTERVYDPPDIPGYFEKCVWPEYVKHLNEVKTSSKDVVFFDDSSSTILDTILRDMYSVL